MRRRASDGSAGVSSVVGTVLMLGITMAVFAGFSYVVLESYAGSQDRARADVGVVQEGSSYLLQHRGGEALALADGRLLVTVDGADQEVDLAEFAAQTADGTSWRIGESLCVAGPGPPCRYEDSAVTRLMLVHGNAVILSDTPEAADPPLVTYVTSAVATRGSVAAFAAAQDASDGGAEASLAEASTAVPAGSVSPTKLAGTPGTAGGAVDPTLVQASDDAWAELDAAGDYLEVAGFTLPANAETITSLSIGYEGRKSGNGGNDPTTRLDHRIGAGAYVLGPSITESATADTDRTVALTGLDPDDVRALTVRVVHVADTNRNPLVDQVFVTVGYTTAATTTYDLSVQMDVAGVPEPTGAEHTLQLRYRVAGEAFRVQVWDETDFVTRGVPLGSTTSRVWQHELAPTEVDAGVVRVRFVDADGSSTTPGTLGLAYVRVVTQ